MSKIDIEKLVENITSEVKKRLEGVSKDIVENCGSSSANDCRSCGHCVSNKKETVDNIIRSGASRIGAASGVKNFDENLASMIDHTILKPNATKEDVEKIAKEALNYGFATVCVNASYIPLVAGILKGSQVKPIAVVGFPLGAALKNAKAFEAREAIRAGAKEIDMVINIGALKSKDYGLVYEDIKRVVEASKPYNVKVIIEASELNDEEKIIACTLSKMAKARFVKTSTGFGKGGATVHDVALMRRVVGKDLGVKASGGIRTFKDAEEMIKAGANRIGASASVAIVTKSA